MECAPRSLCASVAERIFLFVVPKRLRAFRNYFFTERGRREKRQLQRRFLRKRGAAGSNLALSVCSLRSHPPLPKGEALAKPQALRFDWKLCRYAKGSPFGRAGALAPERARVLPTRAYIPKQRYYFPFPLQKTKSGSPRAVRLVLAFNRFYSSTSSLSKNAIPNAPGPVWVPMTQPIWRTSGASRCRLSCR